ncbi:MAG: hypothetical protein RSC92_03530 [Clostridia bacterium]
MQNEKNNSNLINSWIAYNELAESKLNAYILTVELERDPIVEKYSKLVEGLEEMESKINKKYKEMNEIIFVFISEEAKNIEIENYKLIKRWKKLYHRKKQFQFAEKMMKLLEEQFQEVAEYATKYNKFR